MQALSQLSYTPTSPSIPLSRRRQEANYTGGRFFAQAFFELFLKYSPFYTFVIIFLAMHAASHARSESYMFIQTTWFGIRVGPVMVFFKLWNRPFNLAGRGS
ncbi:hypothetical protein [Chromobacterium sp. IIBBL 290-4]|uniref:hypothetical protein n=1 Tax=Chromobacterium sp. IIBBL 290-4 TaxID=2953890 RepID=UPI0020B7BA20|nr:hypothetical protein [Chromobacterium sp. IIBBL 290-4]UTH73162.1 hypothetical protein NKT35_16715 [Chromobacterium sp. IIBBL 290-4]